MKKYLYLAIVALMGAMMMVGCKPKNTPSGTDPVDPSTLDNKTVKCWEYTLTESGKSATLYFWGTERSLVTFIEGEVEKAKNEGFIWTYTYKASKETDLDACMERNNEGADCWKVTVTKGGSSKTEYLFTSYECAEIYAKAEAGSTGSYKIEKAEPKDPDSCDALNGPSGGGGGSVDPPIDNSEVKCWEVTQIDPEGGESVTWYAWTTEESLVATLENQKASQGVTYSYKEADADDMDSCLAKNEY